MTDEGLMERPREMTENPLTQEQIEWLNRVEDKKSLIILVCYIV